MVKQINMNVVCAPSEDVVAREIEGEIIIVPLVSGIGDVADELYTLNETGQAIWQKLDGQRTLKDVAALLAAEFDTPLTNRKEILKGLLVMPIKPIVTAERLQKELDALERPVNKLACYTIPFDKNGAIVAELFLPRLSQKNNFLPPRRGRMKVGGKRSTTSTLIPTFPHRKGEGGEIRNRLILIQ